MQHRAAGRQNPRGTDVKALKHDVVRPYAGSRRNRYEPRIAPCLNP